MKTLISAKLLPAFAVALLAPSMLVAQDQTQLEEPDPTDLFNPLANAPAETTPKKPAGPIDPDLPQPFDPANVQAAMKTLPFNRSVNMSESLILTGLAHIHGKPVATLINKETKKTYVVSEEPNAEGWKLEDVKPTMKLNFSQVKVNVGGEVVTIRYDQAALDESKKKGDHPSPGGGPPPGDRRPDDNGMHRERRGPPPEAIERYQKLSDDAKNKLRKHFEDNRERIMNMNPEERRAFMEKSFTTIASEDEAKRK